MGNVRAAAVKRERERERERTGKKETHAARTATALGGGADLAAELARRVKVDALLLANGGHVRLAQHRTDAGFPCVTYVLVIIIKYDRYHRTAISSLIYNLNFRLGLGYIQMNPLLSKDHICNITLNII